MFRKRTWVMGLLSVILLFVTMAQNDDGSSFQCKGFCTGDVCE